MLRKTPTLHSVSLQVVRFRNLLVPDEDLFIMTFMTELLFGRLFCFFKLDEIQNKQS